MNSGENTSTDFSKVVHGLLNSATRRINELISGSYSEDLKLEGLVALGRIGDPESTDLLIKSLEKFSENTEPLTAMGYFKNRDTVPQLLKLLENPEISFKEEIVRVLGEIADPRASTALRDLLHDQDRMVRYQAAWSLYKLGGRDVPQTLSGLLSDPDEWIVINVLEILSRLKDAEVIPSLVGQFKIVRDHRLKAIIISSLGLFGESQLLPIFEEGLKSFDTRIQANAVEAISLLRIPEIDLKRKLKRFLTHPNNRVKANAAVALYSTEPDKVREELELMISSKDVPTRRSAAYVLSRIQLTGQGKLLDPLLSDPAFSVRKMALKASVAFESIGNAGRYISYLRDENPWVRKEAVVCARKIFNFPDDQIIESFKTENNHVVWEAQLDHIVEKKLGEGVAFIVQKIKERPDEGMPMLISSLGRLNSREPLLGIKKFLDINNPEGLREYYIGLLQCGELSVLNEVNNLFLEKNREEELQTWTKIIGEIGSFLRSPEKFSQRLSSLLSMEVKKTDESKAAGKPAPEEPIPPNFSEGLALFEQGKLDEAYKFMMNYLKKFPEHQDSLYFIAAILFRKGDSESALPVLRRLLKQNPDYVQAKQLLGQIFFFKKDWNSLLEAYEPFLNSENNLDDKGKSQILGALGVAYFHLRRFPKAISTLEKAMEINPRDRSSHYHLALSHYALKDKRAALKLLKDLRKGLPSDSRVLRNVEELLQKLEEEG